MPRTLGFDLIVLTDACPCQCRSRHGLCPPEGQGLCGASVAMEALRPPLQNGASQAAAHDEVKAGDGDSLLRQRTGPSSPGKRPRDVEEGRGTEDTTTTVKGHSIQVRPSIPYLARTIALLCGGEPSKEGGRVCHVAGRGAGGD